jgi:beta-xylosidase
MIVRIFLLAALLFWIGTCAGQSDSLPSFGNPIITNKYTADPAALVHQGRVYLYTGHDEAAPGEDNYVMHDWLCFSSADLVHWTEYKAPLRATDFAWVEDGAWASQVIERDGKFYWYVAVKPRTMPGRARPSGGSIS